jgi:hypothetical protein
VTVTLQDLPVVSIAELRRRIRPEPMTRRRFLGRTAAAASAVSFAYLALWDVKPSGAAPYYKEYTSTTAGPCASGGYASNHTEEGRKCGPSSPSSSYCWTGSSSVSGEAEANTGNKLGWHKYGSFGGSGYYLQRPDECYSGGYDSWRWKFSDGKTYGCSDGKACSFYSCIKTICPYVR